jgi:hypothetical protein
VRAAFLLDVARVPKARLLESAPRPPVLLVDGGDARGGADDVADERPQDLGAETPIIPASRPSTTIT